MNVDKWITSRGPLDAIARIKCIRLHVTRYICGEPLLTTSHPSLGLDKQGLPRCLGPLKELVRSEEPNDRRLLFTLLRVSSMILAFGTVDLSPITNPSKACNKMHEILEEASEVLGQLNWRLELEPWSQFHLTTKAGPTGPALLSSLQDLHNLPDWLIISIGKLGGEDLIDRMNLMKDSIPLDEWLKGFELKKSSLIRKLSIIHDPEAKERVIAILDYWSQTALKPLHDAEFQLLRRISGDCTFNQGDFTRWLPTSGPYFSLDLSNATDRFPLVFQKNMLSQLIGQEKADAWEQIMVKEGFSYQGETYTYSVGQPMGAYSSWATFALSHHLVVRMAAKRAGKPVSWCNYALLGDDIVLTDPKVSYQYKTLMSSLGVDISQSKTHVSDDTYEFAKRWIQRGVEITGPRINGFTEKRYYLLAENIRELLSRWFDPLETMAIPGLAYLLRKLQIPVRKSKMNQLLLMPRREDVDDDSCQRIRLFLTSIFGSYLGCNRSAYFLKGFTFQTMAEVKTHFIESRLKTNFQKARPFLTKVAQIGMRLGLVDHSILHKSPPVAVVLANINGLQDDWDRLRSAYWDSDKDIVFNKVIRNGLDPERILSQRSVHLLLQTNAALINHYQGWAKAYMATRDEEISSPPQAAERADHTYWSSLEDE